MIVVAQPTGCRDRDALRDGFGHDRLRNLSRLIRPRQTEVKRLVYGLGLGNALGCGALGQGEGQFVRFGQDGTQGQRVGVL